MQKLNYQKLLWTCVILGAVTSALAKKKFLAEKPQQLVTCRRADENFKSCYTKTYQNIFKVWKSGLPGLSINSIDPLQIKRVTIIQDDENPVIRMNLNMRNVNITGLSELHVQDLGYDFDKYILTANVNVPNLEFIYDYVMMARLFGLPLQGSGVGYMKIRDFHVIMTLQHKLRHEFGHTFADADHLILEIVNIGGFQMNLQNLFNGQKELEDSTNAIFNQNWRDILVIMMPALKQTSETFLIDILKKFYAYVPITYLIEDFETADS